MSELGDPTQNQAQIWPAELLAGLNSFVNRWVCGFWAAESNPLQFQPWEYASAGVIQRIHFEIHVS